MKKILVIFSAILTVLTCGNFTEEKRKENEIVINSPYDFITSSYSVLDTTVNRLLYEGLTRKDEEGKIVPGLAERWDVTPDGKIWTFYLRDDIKYSDGTPVTAEDFLFGWSRGKYKGRSFDDGYARITAVNDKTLTIEVIKDGREDFLEMLSSPQTVPRKKGYPENGYDYRITDVSKIVSTGPYILKEWKTERIVLEKNPYYWNSQDIKSEKITWKYAKNLSDSLREFEKGKADVTEIKVGDAEKYKGKQELKQIETGSYSLLLFNDRIEIMRNSNIRKAILMAIERNPDLPKNYISQYTKYADISGALPPSIPEYNPEEAKKMLLKEIGNTDSLPELIFLSYNPGNSKKALKIKDNLEKNLGLKIRIISKYDKKYDTTFALKLEELSKRINDESFLDTWTGEERVQLRHLNEEATKKDTVKEEKIRLSAELDKRYAEKIPYILVEDKVYRYFLVSAKSKGISVTEPHGEIVLRYPYIKE